MMCVEKSDFSFPKCLSQRFKPLAGAKPGKAIGKECRAGTEIRFEAIARVDSPVEVSYLRGGGILPTVLRQLLKKN